MSAPLFYLPKAFLDASPEALGLPDFGNSEEELESGTLEQECFEKWSRDQADYLLNELEELL